MDTSNHSVPLSAIIVESLVVKRSSILMFQWNNRRLQMNSEEILCINEAKGTHRRIPFQSIRKMVFNEDSFGIRVELRETSLYFRCICSNDYERWKAALMEIKRIRDENKKRAKKTEALQEEMRPSRLLQQLEEEQQGQQSQQSQSQTGNENTTSSVRVTPVEDRSQVDQGITVSLLSTMTTSTTAAARPVIDEKKNEAEGKEYHMARFLQEACAPIAPQQPVSRLGMSFQELELESANSRFLKDGISPSTQSSGGSWKDSGIARTVKPPPLEHWRTNFHLQQQQQQQHHHHHHTAVQSFSGDMFHKIDNTRNFVVNLNSSSMSSNSERESLNSNRFLQAKT